MPSVAQELPTVQSCKKRRRDDDNNNNHHHQQLQLYADLLAMSAISGANQHPFLSSHSVSTTPRGTIFVDKNFDHGVLFQHPPLHQSSPHAATRKIMPLQSAKRRRTSVDRDVGALEGEPMQRSPSSSPSRKQQQQQQQHHHHHPQQQIHHTKSAEKSRQTIVAADDAPSSTALIDRCHICFRKPTKKSDLDSFADCQGCGLRTCYVCIRECLGWGPNLEAELLVPPPTAATDTSFTMLDVDAVEHGDGDVHVFGEEQRDLTRDAEGGGRGGGGGEGWARGGGHRQVVCSRCCVEKGEDGDVVCLGCLPFIEG
ncbi:IBR domain-containing protein [Madurella fahalii]|uniref:IBR domain-containing protein n=1 Tax=Madurella fahalii TaxID=1157608 RepID=A0ABQ0FY97_9PEZI